MVVLIIMHQIDSCSVYCILQVRDEFFPVNLCLCKRIFSFLDGIMFNYVFYMSRSLLYIIYIY